jgi:hypothetical protein
MGWFSRRLSGSQKEEALAMVRHLQTMLAYQQLAMETYNDAIAIASGRIPHGSEVTQRAYANLSDPTLVAQYVIPAVAKKIEIFQSIEMKHREVSVLATANLKVPYQEMTVAINAWLERARYQYHVFQQWVNDPQVDINTVRLDRYELAVTDRALKALNDLIFRKIRLTRDEWLDIVQEATNSVRASLKLVPLSKATFRSQYMQGISGERVRLFKD